MRYLVLFSLICFICGCEQQTKPKVLDSDVKANLGEVVKVVQEKAIEVDPLIQPYQTISGVGGTLTSIGSDTLNNLMAFWAEEFHKRYPNVQISIEGKGSATAPPALLSGTAQLGPMSRKMKAEEVQKIRNKYGYEPSLIAVAIDAIAVFVNKDNILEQLTLPQVDAIFSKNRKGEYSEDIVRWGQLGLTGDFTNRPISLYGRNSASGTYGYFKEHALFKGDYKDMVKEQPGSSAVVNGVSADLYSIGYSGVGYVTSSIKPLKIASKEGMEYYSPSYQNVLENKYPISRFLYIYFMKAPEQQLSPTVAEFLKFILSKEGQQVVIKDGNYPLNKQMVDKELAKLK